MVISAPTHYFLCSGVLRRKLPDRAAERELSWALNPRLQHHASLLGLVLEATEDDYFAEKVEILQGFWKTLRPLLVLFSHPTTWAVGFWGCVSASVSASEGPSWVSSPLTACAYFVTLRSVYRSKNRVARSFPDWKHMSRFSFFADLQ